MTDFPAGMIVTMNDITLAGYCALGARRWFEHYDLDFRAFLNNGITAEALLATGDAMAERVVASKMERQGG